MFSRRSNFSREPNRVSLARAHVRRSSEPIWDLTISNPTLAGIPYAETRIMHALADARSLKYQPEPFGMNSARAAVCHEWGLLGFDVEPARILLSASTSEAYSFLFKLLCDPGDEILIPSPSYPLLEQLAELEGVRLVSYRLRYDGAWYIDVDSLRRARGPRARAVLAVSPNNPTGSFLKKDELSALSELGLPIVCDEVFASYALWPDQARVRSVLESESGLVFSLGGLSKSAALPQLKLSWTTLGGARALVDEAMHRLAHIADAFLSTSTLLELALPELLASRHVAASAIWARLVRNLKSLGRTLEGSALTLLHIEGGWYAVVRLPNTSTDEDWVIDLLEHERVLVEPGYFYDFAEGSFAVLSLLTQEAVFDEGTLKLRSFVDRRS